MIISTEKMFRNRLGSTASERVRRSTDPADLSRSTLELKCPHEHPVKGRAGPSTRKESGLGFGTAKHNEAFKLLKAHELI